MANYNCSACNELREKAPNLIVNGMTSKECTYLKNDTGVAGTSTDCVDLDLMNDCLVGNMAEEVDAYEVCEWKEFMPKFIKNLWNVLKAIICSMCGIWTNIHKHECEIATLYNGVSFSVGEEPSDGSYVVAGKGVSFYNVGAGIHSSNITFYYVGGGLSILSGSCLFYTADFTDADECVNFDLGSTERTSTSRKGNSVWSGTGVYDGKGELAYEVRIKLSQYPEIKTLFEGRGQESAGGSFHVNVIPYVAGQYADGQHGECNINDGTPYSAGADSGHLVPDGWLYLQCRIHSASSFPATSGGTQLTPRSYVPIRINRAKIDC